MKLRELLESEDMIGLLYPEKRNVPASKIMGWAEDAFANREINHKPTDLQDAINQLEDAGHITTMKGHKPHNKDFF